tara:strand:- start:890 stop:1660 length:771 start_codon:yes stop_codon:yes gene_type:complete
MAQNSQFLKKNPNIINIYGYHSVIAALKNKNRSKKRLVLTENSAKILKKKFKGSLPEICIISKKKFERIYYSEENNQEIVLEALRLPNNSINNILNQTENESHSILLMLDRVNDPHNIGSIMRSAALFGSKAVIVSNDNAPDMNSTIIKSASGGAEIVDYIKVTNLVRCIQEIKKKNYWVIGLDSESTETIDKFEIPNKCLFIIGSEHSGLRELTKKNCDYLISIKSKNIMNLEIDSLNVSNATSIALYEYFKKSK